MSLQKKIEIVNEKIKQACSNSGRNLSDVQIIIVTKYVSDKNTEEALDSGFVHIGENRVNNGLHKYELFNNRATWHFIGNLQTRKVKDIIGKFNYIHSLDRLSLAKEIDKRAKQMNTKVKCFVQVNVSQEETKSGINPEEIMDFFKDIVQYDSIEIVGLMTMAPFYDDRELTRPIFRRLRELRDLINEKNILNYKINELSMGMSNDFEVAIEEGATFVRLGSIYWNE